MSEESLKLKFQDDNGIESEFEIIEETRIRGINYILVADDEDNAYIFKDTSTDEDVQACYEPVEDENEVTYISGVFAELLEDVDLIF